MGLYGRKEEEEAGHIQYTLHIVCVIEDWNPMHYRDFVAVDLPKRRFYSVREQLGAWNASYYAVCPIDSDALRRLFSLAKTSNLQNHGEPVDDWSSFADALQGAEIVEITKEQLM